MFSVPRSRTRSQREDDGDAGVPRVLVTSRPPRHRLGYVDQLVGDDSGGDAPRGVEREYDTNPFHIQRVDVVYLTDLTKAIGTSRTSERERTRRAKKLVGLLRRQGVALVRSVHPDEAHRPPSRAETILDQAAVGFVALTATRSATGIEPTVVPHSHLRARFMGFPHEEIQPGRVLITGLNVLPDAYEAPVKVFAAAGLRGWTLRIAGGISEELKDSYARTLGDHPDSISLRDDLLSDASSVMEISRAEAVLVVTPDDYESQSIILLGLSLDRPVIVEDTPTTRSLAAEVGDTWVRRHSGPLTADSLEAVLRSLRAAPPVGHPNLSAREPNAISAQYIAMFRAAAERR